MGQSSEWASRAGMGQSRGGPSRTGMGQSSEWASRAGMGQSRGGASRTGMGQEQGRGQQDRDGTEQ